MRRAPTRSDCLGASPRRILHAEPLRLDLSRSLAKQQELHDWQAIQQMFAGANGGYWDLTTRTVFTESSGTGAATAGSPIGTVMDVSRDLKLGPELVTTPTAGRSEPTADWGTVYVGSGLIVGHLYKVKLVVDSVSASEAGFVASVSLSGVGTTGTYAGAVIDTIARATGTLVGVYCRPYATFSISGISVREIAGNHALQSTTANKPILRRTSQTGVYWLDADSTDSLNATFNSSLGSLCTVARVGSGGITFLENQTIATTYNIAIPYGWNGDVMIINRVLNAAEKAIVTRYMMRKRPNAGELA